MAVMTEQGTGGRGWRRWGWAAASVLLHTGLLAALVVATEEEGELAAESVDEEVTYVDISSFPPPPPLAPTAREQEPQPQAAEPQPTRPEPRPQRPPQAQTPPRSTDIVEPVDSMPEPLGEVPAPAPIQAPRVEGPPSGAVSTTPQPGGQAGGVQGGVEGGRVGGQVGATGPPDEGGTFVAAVVDRRAELTNRRELPRIMERLYPDVLKEAGIGGRVVVQFVVEPSGRIDMSTVKVMSAEHDGFVDATRRALREFRFSPARMGDRKVRMLTQMPIVWQVEGI
ncbi:MAG: TonB family protein [Gemmatimonadetes bacterium]|nr:TonB family protein [Gemmatimonadota bacterium]